MFAQNDWAVIEKHVTPERWLAVTIHKSLSKWVKKINIRKNWDSSLEPLNYRNVLFFNWKILNALIRRLDAIELVLVKNHIN